MAFPSGRFPTTGSVSSFSRTSLLDHPLWLPQLVFGHFVLSACCSALIFTKLLKINQCSTPSLIKFVVLVNVAIKHIIFFTGKTTKTLPTSVISLKNKKNTMYKVTRKSKKNNYRVCNQSKTICFRDSFILHICKRTLS